MYKYSQTLDIMASVPDYGSISEETRKLYGWSLILEVGSEPVTLSVIDSPSAGSASSAPASMSMMEGKKEQYSYDWHVKQHDGTIILR